MGELCLLFPFFVGHLPCDGVNMVVPLLLLRWLLAPTASKGRGGVQFAGRPYRPDASGADDQRDVSEARLLRHPGGQFDVDEQGAVGQE